MNEEMEGAPPSPTSPVPSPEACSGSGYYGERYWDQSPEKQNIAMTGCLFCWSVMMTRSSKKPSRKKTTSACMLIVTLQGATALQLFCLHSDPEVGRISSESSEIRMEPQE